MSASFGLVLPKETSSDTRIHLVADGYRYQKGRTTKFRGVPNFLLTDGSQQGGKDN